jgi:hypothetical protein
MEEGGKVLLADELNELGTFEVSRSLKELSMEEEDVIRLIMELYD